MKVSGMLKFGNQIYANLKLAGFKSVMETIWKKKKNLWQVFINLANMNYQCTYAE